VAHWSKRCECRQTKNGFLHFVQEYSRRGFFFQRKWRREQEEEGLLVSFVTL
jgi:hypothetical protein